MIRDEIDRKCRRCGVQFSQEEGKPTEFCSRNCAEGFFMDATARELRAMGLPVGRRTD